MGIQMLKLSFYSSMPKFYFVVIFNKLNIGQKPGWKNYFLGVNFMKIIDICLVR